LEETREMALRGVSVVEFSGIGPGPFLGTILADFGADVVCIERTRSVLPSRGKRSILVDLKQPQTLQAVKSLCSKADVLIDPFRPGVMEKLGLGPEVLMALNPRLIFARLTGFGQKGAYATMAGHDINYAAISGVLSMLGRKGSVPTPPVNLLADFAGGSFACAIGILLCLYERERSGKGQVIDNAMIDSVLYMSTFLWAGRTNGLFTMPRGENLLDTGAPFYDVYLTKDEKFMSVGALEPQFYAILVDKLGVKELVKPQNQQNRALWPEVRQIFKEKFMSKTRDEWQKIFDHTDACVLPVLELHEISENVHTSSREMLDRNPEASVSDKGILEGFTPQPAPRLSRTPGTVAHKTERLSLDEVLTQFGSPVSKL